MAPKASNEAGWVGGGRLACGHAICVRTPGRPRAPGNLPMSRWLVTGSAGMLGQDLGDRPRRRRARGDPGSPRVPWTSPTSRPAGRPCAATTSSSTPPRGPPWTTPRRTRPQAFAVNATGAANLARGVRRGRCRAGAGLHRLRLRRGRHDAVRRGRPARAAVGLRAHQGRRRVGRGRPVPAQLGGAHRVAVRRAAGPSFVSTMARLAARAGHPRRGGRPARPAHVDDGPGPHRSRPLVTSGAPYGAYHATELGGDDVVRLRPRDLLGPRPRPRAGAPHDHGGVPAAGAATGVLRARARRLAPRRHRPDPDWREALAEALPSIVAAG